MSLYVEKRENPGKPNLVMLHGWGMSSEVWAGFADQLAEHFSLILIDLPGLGRSVEYPQPYTTDAVTALLREEVSEPAIWLGWSMGGQLAISFAHRFPKQVLSLVTIASNPCFVQRKDWSSAMDEDTHQAFESSLQQDLKKTLTRFIMLQTQGAVAGREILKQLKLLLKTLQPTAAGESLGLLRDDARQELAALECPVLQLFGEKDLLVPVGAAEDCSQLAGQRAVVYPEAGHLPFLSHTNQLVADILSFVNAGES